MNKKQKWYQVILKYPFGPPTNAFFKTLLEAKRYCDEMKPADGDSWYAQTSSLIIKNDGLAKVEEILIEANLPKENTQKTIRR